MLVTPIEHGIELNRPAPGYVRTPGLHASQIYGDLYSALEPKRYGGTDGPDPLRMELGLALEEGLEASLRARWGFERHWGGLGASALTSGCHRSVVGAARRATGNRCRAVFKCQRGAL